MDALNQFFEESIPLYKNFTKPWQGFRDKELWTLPVEDCLHMNLDGLEQVYDRFRKKRYMQMRDAMFFMQYASYMANDPREKEKEKKGKAAAQLL